MANWKVWVTKFSGADGSVLWNRKLLDEACAAAVVPGWRSGLHVVGGVIYADIAANPVTGGVYLWGTDAGFTAFQALRYDLAGGADGGFGLASFPPTDVDATFPNGIGRGCAAAADGSLLGYGVALDADFINSLGFVSKILPSGALDTAFSSDGIAVPLADATQQGNPMVSAGARPGGSGQVGFCLLTNAVLSLYTLSAAGAVVSQVDVVNAVANGVSLTACALLAGGLFTAVEFHFGDTTWHLVVYDSGGAVTATLPKTLDTHFAALAALAGGGLVYAQWDFLGGTLTLVKYDTALTPAWTTGALAAPTSTSGTLGVAEGPDGKITAGVYYGPGAPGASVKLYRFLATGAADTAFGTGGTLTFAAPASEALSVQGLGFALS